MIQAVLGFLVALIVFYILISIVKGIFSLLGSGIGSASGITEQQAKTATIWSIVISSLYIFLVINNPDQLIYGFNFPRGYSNSPNPYLALFISFVIPPILITAFIVTVYRIKINNEKMLAESEDNAIKRKATDIAKSQITSAIKTIQNADEKINSNESINKHDQSEVDKNIDYNHESLDSLQNIAKFKIIEYGGTYKLVSTSEDTDEIVKENFFSTDSAKQYLIKRLNDERAYYLDSLKTPAQRLYEKLKSLPNFLHENGYTYTLVNNNHALRIINKECGSYLDIFHGNDLIPKESENRYKMILGEYRSFDDLNVIGEGYHISGNLDLRGYDPSDEYVYYFGESIDDVIDFLKNTNNGEACFEPTINWHGRTFNPWNDKFDRLENHNNHMSYFPDRTPLQYE